MKDEVIDIDSTPKKHMMNYFPPSPMFHRLALAFGLLVLPLASANAAYQQDYRIPSDTQIEESTQESERVHTTDVEESDVRPVMDETGVSVWDTDGSAKMTRAVLIANVIRGMYTQSQIDSCFWTIAPSHPPSFDLVFTDVSVDHPYAKEICIAMRDGIVRGYLDGSFGPDRILTFAESAKILSRAYVLAPYAHTDVRNPWYAGHVRALIVRNAVPVSITTLSQQVTSGEVREMLDRLENGITWRTAQTEEVLFPPVIIRRPAVVPAAPAAPTGSATSSQSSAASVVKSATPTSAATSSAASQLPSSTPASSRQSFWDLF